MTFPRLFRNSIIRALLAALMLSCGVVRAQNVVLHLRNGDRITGVVLSETTNQVTLSNLWSREIIVPLAEIERREVRPAPTPAPAPAAANNLAAGKRSTNYIRMMIVPEPPDTNLMVWLKRWKGEASVGMDLERGTVDHQLYYGKAKLSYAQPYVSDPKEFFRNIFNYDVAYGKTDGTLSDNRMGGSSKTDFDLNREEYVYNLGAASHDQIRAIDLHYEDGPGLGYHLFNQTNLALNLEAGANYQVEYRSDETSTESGYYRLGQDLAWKLNKQVNLTEKIEYFPRFGYATQWRMRFESNLSYSLILNLSLNLTVVDQYDTQPAQAIPNNDFQLRTSLGVKF